VQPTEVPVTQPDPQFEALLLYLKEARGFDFTGYKRSSLMRRVGRRMGQINVADYAEYLDYLQVHPEEFTALFNTILINVPISSATRRRGSTCAPRSCPGSWPARTTRPRCGCGAPAAPRARRRTAWR
jgi:CheR methyltransferase-like protein